jgi:hypothetical protein
VVQGVVHVAERPGSGALVCVEKRCQLFGCFSGRAVTVPQRGPVGACQQVSVGLDLVAAVGVHRAEHA